MRRKILLLLFAMTALVPVYESVLVFSQVQPIVGKGTIVSWYWVSTGGFYVNIQDRDVAVVKVRQDAPVGAGGATLVIVPSISAVAPVKITPTSDASIIPEGETHTFRFEVENLGATTEMELTITFEVVNDLGTVTDTKSLDFKLLVVKPTPEPTPPVKPQPYEPISPMAIIFFITTIVFITTTIYFAKRKPKTA